MLAAAALMFAACAQFDTVNEVPESEPQAIGFDTYAQLPTRATENNEGTYTDTLKLHHDNFAVWAFKNTSTVPVFGADPTTDPTAGTTVSAEDYSYGPLKYWDKTADNYYFYAAAPVTTTEPKWTLNGVTDIATQANGYFTISNVILAASNFRTTTPNASPTTTFKSADKDKDLMIAAPNTTKFSEVQLKFIHILSRLNIIVKKDAAAPAITLNSVKVYNINLKGSFNESIAANTAGSIARWTPAATPVTTTPYAYISDLALTTENQYIIESLVIPQNVAFEDLKTDGTTVVAETKPYLEVIYTITGEQYKAYYNLAATFGKTTGESLPFNEGWQNTLTITISPASITFAGNVSTWSENTDDQPIN